MAMPEIEHDVPLPPIREPGRGNPSPQQNAQQKYPFPSMKPGDSFFVPAGRGVAPIQVQRRLSSAAASWRRRNNPEAVFVSRSDANGARVWRVS